MPAAIAGDMRSVLWMRTKLYQSAERDHVRVVFELFAESVRQPREASHSHPHREVRPLGIGRADVLRVGIAGDVLRAGSDAL